MRKNIKRIMILIFVSVMICNFSACEEEGVSVGDQGVTVNTIEELEVIIENDVVDTVSGLQAEYEQLAAEITTFDQYLANIETVNAFYNKVIDENKAICIRMREYSIAYTELVMMSDGSLDDKYDDLEELHNFIYEDACEAVYDGIYAGLMVDIYNLMDGISVNDLYSVENYKEWYEAYELWTDTVSNVYSEWSDSIYDIYAFWSDVRAHLLNEDLDSINDEIVEFKEDVKELREETVE